MPEFLLEKLSNNVPNDNSHEIVINASLENTTVIKTDGRQECEEGNGTGPLRDLRRLRQLVQEIQTALGSGNVSVVSQAATLLAPALAQWAKTRPLVDPNDRQMLQITQETQRAMTECEQSMRLALSNIEAKRNHLRQHQRHLKRLRALRPMQYSGRSLDARQ